MAPNLQGLNIVHPQNTFDSSSDLLSGPFPELAAQLDLWTHLPFETEEGSHHALGGGEMQEKDSSSSKQDDSTTPDPSANDSHVNVSAGIPIPQQQHNNFDLNAILASFNAGAFPPPLQQQQPPPSLVQLLAMAAQQNPSFMNGGYDAPPRLSDNGTISREEAGQPPAKRARARKPSISTSVTSATAESPETGSLLSPAEDKRRRNTAASARFRMKKKEREAALEGKAKELEARVNELERECEGLKRENGWLKGLVVGVTGAAQQQQQQQQQHVGSGTKRTRDD